MEFTKKERIILVEAQYANDKRAFRWSSWIVLAAGWSVALLFLFSNFFGEVPTWMSNLSETAMFIVVWMLLPLMVILTVVGTFAILATQDRDANLSIIDTFFRPRFGSTLCKWLHNIWLLGIIGLLAAGGWTFSCCLMVVEFIILKTFNWISRSGIRDKLKELAEEELPENLKRIEAET